MFIPLSADDVNRFLSAYDKCIKHSEGEREREKYIYCMCIFIYMRRVIKCGLLTQNKAHVYMFYVRHTN